jgi:hypothetical protein
VLVQQCSSYICLIGDEMIQAAGPGRLPKDINAWTITVIGAKAPGCADEWGEDRLKPASHS